jgi:hypothetical protein
MLSSIALTTSASDEGGDHHHGHQQQQQQQQQQQRSPSSSSAQALQSSSSPVVVYDNNDFQHSQGQQQPQQQQQVQQVIVIHQVRWCPRVKNWTPFVMVVAFLIVLMMVCACLLAVMNFSAFDDAYYLRSGQYYWWVIAQYCQDMPGAYKVTYRKDIDDTDVKAVCGLPDDTKVCWSSKQCVKASDITWIWALSLILFVYTWCMVLIVVFFVVMRTSHLSNAKLRHCGRSGGNE